MNQLFSSWQNSSIILVLVLVWSLFWKGLALWKAARQSQKIWFVALLIINTVGILEILYYFIFSNDEIIKKLKGIFSGKGKESLPPVNQ